MSHANSDDNDFIENGDLGLGLGLKPGGIRTDIKENNNLQHAISSIETSKSKLFNPVVQNKYRYLPFLKVKRSAKNYMQTEIKDKTPSVERSCDQIPNQCEFSSNRVMNKSSSPASG
jgi:hypothetical protein